MAVSGHLFMSTLFFISKIDQNHIIIGIFFLFNSQDHSLSF